MTDTPSQVVVAVFKTEAGADQALYNLKAAQATGYIGIQKAAVLRRDKEDELRIHETHDWGPGKGAAVGGVLGAIIGVIAGPGVIVVSAAGAAIGGLAAKLRDSGFDDTRLKQLGECLTPGTSALVAAVEEKWVAELEAQLAAADGELVTEAVAAEIAQELEAEGDAA